MDIEKYSDLAPQYYGNKVPFLVRKYLVGDFFKRLLDCGCGDGDLLDAMRKAGLLRDRKVCAIDLSKKRVERVKNSFKEISVYVDNAEEMNCIESGSVDFFIATQVIEHVNNEKMACAIDRVLTRDGIAYLATIFKKWYGWYFYRNGGKWVLDPAHLIEYSDDSQLLDYFRKDKFEIMESRKTLLWFPISDFLIKRFGVKSRRVYDNFFMNIIRKVKVPIFGYHNWELILRKK